MKNKCSVIILAAGKSTRMGTPKFLLKYNNKTTFLEKIIKEYEAFGCKEINVVLNEKGVNLLKNNIANSSNKLKIVINYHPEWERFYSLKLGIEQLDKKRKVFVHNVDNPFVNHKVLKSLIENISEFDYAVPTYKGRGGHPVLLSKKVIRNIIAEKENGMNLKDYLSNYNKVIVQVNDENILVNVNSKEDYDLYSSASA
ncbi:MAG: hypothetical protein DRJ07_18275 [Bacteroidetes bacterium]|nr:MAG: hypothetical protein DRJ07_18275 [Bacteroidota bacterium]